MLKGGVGRARRGLMLTVGKKRRRRRRRRSKQ